MPREMYLIGERPVGLPELVAAGAPVDPELGVRALYEGVALQTVDVNDVAVLTIETSRMVTDRDELARIAPKLDLNAVSGRIAVDPGYLVDPATGRLVPVDDAGGLDPGALDPGAVGAQTGWRCWWTEATAPWGDPGLPGVEIMNRLAEGMHGAILIEEGL